MIASTMFYLFAVVFWISCLIICITGALWVEKVIIKEIFDIDIAELIVRKWNERNHKTVKIHRQGR